MDVGVLDHTISGADAFADRRSKLLLLCLAHVEFAELLRALDHATDLAELTGVVCPGRR